MKGEALRESIGFFGVVASLVFVGLEVRQNTLATRAAAYQDMGTALSELWLSTAEDPGRALATLRYFEGTAPESSEEAAALMSQTIAALRQYEVVWRQVQLGLLDEEVLGYFGWAPWESARAPQWDQVREFMSPDFREFLEEAAAARP